MKLKVLDKEYDVLNVKTISTESSMITIEDKIKGLVILISKDIKENISNFKGFKFIRNEDKRFVELLGLDVVLEITIATKLNISKKIMYLEEIKDLLTECNKQFVACKKTYRLTFSSSFFKNLKDIETIDIES